MLTLNRSAIFREGTMLLRACGMIVALALASPQRTAAQQQVNGCPSTTTDTAARLLLRFARVSVSSPEPEAVAWRVRLGLPALDTTKVVMVKDSKTCTSVVTAFNTYWNTPGAVRTVMIAKLSTTGFMAFEPLPVPGPGDASRAVFLFTTKFAVWNIVIGT
jgi:hypothetical protein